MSNVKVRLVSRRLSEGRVQHKVFFGSGWGAFVESNRLEKGDDVIFSLVAKSKFVIHVFKPTGTLKQRNSKPTCVLDRLIDLQPDATHFCKQDRITVGVERSVGARRSVL